MMIWWGKVDKLFENNLFCFIIFYQHPIVDNNSLIICLLHTFPLLFVLVDKLLLITLDDFRCG